MIINFPIRCDICDTITLIKVGIGHQLTHTQRWECEECGSLNEFSFDAISSYPPRYENFIFNNCAIEDKGELKDLNIKCTLYFDVDFTAPRKLNNTFSPEVLLARTLRIREEFENHNNHPATQLKRNQLEMSFKLFKLYFLNKPDTLEKIARRNKSLICYEKNREPLHYVFDYLKIQSAGIGNKTFNLMINEWNRMPDLEKDKLRKFSNRNKIGLHKKLIPLFESYIANLELFWAIFRRERNGLNIINEPQLASEFNKIKGIYADCYESMADYMFILAGINNYTQRLDVNKFNSIKSLEDYHKLDNGSKINPLKDSQQWGFLRDIYLNKVRNACNHNDVEIDNNGNNIVFKDRDNIETLTIQEYLLLCHKIISILSCLILFNELYVLGH